jgi:hypothetical protein
MGHLGRLLMLLLFTAATCAVAAEVHPGDQVRLIEREQHIPAHPAPGDMRVSLRLVSGSQATVLAIHAATGWIEMQGEPIQGTINMGWITPRYLASTPGTGDPTSDTLAWCPPQRLTCATSQWSAAAGHLALGDPPRPGWPIDLARARSLGETHHGG